jgi:hypothetical protein
MGKFIGASGGEVLRATVELDDGSRLVLALGNGLEVVQQRFLRPRELYAERDLEKLNYLYEALEALVPLDRDVAKHVMSRILRVFASAAMQAATIDEFLEILETAPREARRRLEDRWTAEAGGVPGKIYGPPTFGHPQPDGTTLWGGNGRELPSQRVACRSCGHTFEVEAGTSTTPCPTCGQTVHVPITFLSN